MVYILLGNGFEEIEAIAPADILKRGGLNVSFLGIDGTEITGAHGIKVTADHMLDASFAERDFDLLIIPGGGGGVSTIKSSSVALKLVASAYRRGKYIGAICAGPTVLGALNLISGVRAVCFPGCESELVGAKIQTDETVVHDGKIITARAAGSSIDFGLKLLELLRGWEVSEKVRGDLCYDYHEKSLS